MKVKEQFLHYGRFKDNNARKLGFGRTLGWEIDPLKWSILVRKKSVTVVEVLSTTPLNVSFRRALTRVNLESWYRLVASVINTSKRYRHLHLESPQSECSLHVPSI